MEASKVAPPHISKLKSCGVRRATASATRSMSWVRTRVARRDWWASRKVVSVKRARFCLRVHSANFSGPSLSNCCRVPAGGSMRRSTPGSGAEARREGGRYPLASAFPLIETSARNCISLEARSRRSLNSKSAGVLSMKVVVASPERKTGLVTTFSRKGMLVFTPRMRNSRRARCMRSRATGKVWPDVVILTSNES